MALIWKDQYDENHFHLGVRGSHGQVYLWHTVHVDAIADLFGQETYEWARKLIAGTVTEITLTMTEVWPRGG